MPVVRSAEIVLQSFVPINTISDSLKWASTWPKPRWHTIGCVQNSFHCYGTFGTNGYLSCAEINTISKALFGTAPASSGSSHVDFEVENELRRGVGEATFCSSSGSLLQCTNSMCTYLASRLTLSPNRLKRSSSWSTSPRSTILCAQSDFRSYGIFGTNRAPILP
jgi:hypothetical protein